MSNQSDKISGGSRYCGYGAPMDAVNINCLDEGGEETTRRIAYTPSFNPTGTSLVEPAINGADVESFPASSVKPGHAVLATTESVGFWTLDIVPTLPEYHSLERTAVFVPHTAPREVSKRISEVLRQRSIESSYDDEKAKVRCTSAEGVDFRIRLYRGRGRFSHGIIVEVQRRFGISNAFHSDTMAILKGAEGKVQAPPSPNSSNLPLVSESEDDYLPSGSSSLHMVSKMLNHDGYDSYYLAFQTLQSLTDASKMGGPTARAVSKQLLSIENNDVGYKVLSLILDKDKEDEMYKLRSMAMVVLANSLHAVNGSINEMLWEQLRPVLIQELRNSEKTPRNAVQAARAIEIMISKERNLSDIHSALEFAHECGKARHAALERQTKMCLDQIA